MTVAVLPEALKHDVRTLWDYHRLDHEPRPVDVAVGLGSHDPGVAVHASELYHAGLFPLLVFTGANAPTTVQRFPRGEAVHYREIALDHGVPDDAILVEPVATNTGENLSFTRDLLAQRGIPVDSVLLISRPYQQRRAYATARKVWPDVAVRCAARDQTVDAHVAAIGDVERVVNMLVGDTQRITTYAEAGFAIEQDVPEDVRAAYLRLVERGFTQRLIPES